MKARHMFVDARGTMSFVDHLGYRRIISVDGCDQTIAIDALFLSRPMASDLAKVLNHYARTGELPAIEKEEQPE